MPRQLTAAMIAQLEAGLVRPALFVELVFSTETVWVWTGIGTITPPGPASGDSNTFPYGQAFLGVGWLGHISPMPQTTDVNAQNITLTLSGVPTELLSDVINAVRLTGSATVWLGFFDSANNLVGDPSQAFQGLMDVPTITEGATSCSIAITCESALIDMNRAPSHRFTDIDQQFLWPSPPNPQDLGFAQVTALQGLYLGWPLYAEYPGSGTGIPKGNG